MLSIGIGIGAVGALVGLGWALLATDVLTLKEVRIVGNERATNVQVRHLADLPADKNLLLMVIDGSLEHAVANVERHPWIKDVQARLVLPDAVELTVEEHRVRAILMLDQPYLLDSDGTPFRRAVPGVGFQPTDLDHPLITGLSRAQVETEPVLAQRIIHDALVLLDAANDLSQRLSFSDALISEVRFHPLSGYTLALRNGGEVLLGFRDATVLSRLVEIDHQGVDLSKPHRIDLAPPAMAVITPLTLPARPTRASVPSAAVSSAAISSATLSPLHPLSSSPSSPD